MNPLLQLNAFWEKLEKESNLKPTSQAVYHALFQINNKANWKENFQVVFGQVLNMAGIANVKTYYSALEELVAGGYVVWSKGPNQYKAATFSIIVLYQKTEEHTVEHTVEQGESIRHSTRFSTSNILKHINSKHINNKTGGVPPSLDQVIEFFTTKEKSRSMADDFYNHYTANGWIQNKGKPIIDWQAAARGWISRERNFSNEKDHSDQQKFYSGAERAQKKKQLERLQSNE